VDPALRRLIEAGDADDEVAVMVRLEGGAPALPDGVRVVTRFGDVATVRAPRHALEDLRAAAAVRSVKAPRYYRPELVAVEAEAVETADTDRRRPEGLDATGRGVVVGVADWGLDFGHPAFLGRGGGTRVEALWDQAATYDPAHANRFRYGRVHDRGAIDAALQRDDPVAALGYDPQAWDVGGGTHGTATASVAAGSDWRGGVPGVAPDADIVFVNLAGDGGLGHSVQLAEAIDFVRETAGTRPWVLNMSLGRHGGPHDGSTLLEQLMDAAIVEAPGRLIVNSGGNYYSSDVHTSARLGNGEVLRIPLRVDDSMRDVHEIDVWYRGVDRLMVGLTAPDGRTNVLTRPGGDAPLTVDGRSAGRVIHREDDPNNGRNEAVIRIQPDAPSGVWHIVLVGAEVVDGRFHAWIEREALRPGSQARFERDDAVRTTTTGTICNGLRNIAVGAYVPHDPARPLARFSSSGYTVDGRWKPNLLAPGDRVLVARSRPRGTSPEGAPLSTRMSGTSMAAPFVTGTAACLMEATGRVPAARLRAAIIEACEAFEGDDYMRAGGGYLDTAAAFEAVRRSANGRRRPARRGSAPARRRREAIEDVPAETTEAVMTSIEAADPAAQPAPAAPAGLPQPDAVLSSLGLSAHDLFDVYVMDRRASERERLAERVELVAGPGDSVTALQAGDLLVRGTMGEGLATLSVLVTGELQDLRAAHRDDLEPEGRLPGRYAWVVEGGTRPRAREDRFARRVTDRRGYLPTDSAVLRLRAGALTAAPAPVTPEWATGAVVEAVNRQSREYIRWYQAALNQIDSAGLVVDGIVGPLTRGAVRRYQTRKGLAVDGIVGPNTERALMMDGASPPPGYSGPPITPVPPVPPLPPPVPPMPSTTLSALEGRYFPPPGTTEAAPFTRNSSFEPIIDGRDFFGQLKSNIDSLAAGDAWYVAAWWLDPMFRFTSGDSIGDLLVAKATAGVDVRVIVWANRQVIDHPTLAGMFGAAPYQRVVRSNIGAAEDLRSRTDAAGARPLAGRVLIDWSGNAASSHHMKLNVFKRGDQLVAFAGGIDYLQNRLDNPMHRPPTMAWHDAGARVGGDAAERVLSTYVTRWTEASTLSAATYDIGAGTKPYNPPPLVPLAPPAPSPLPASPDTSVQVIRSIMDSKEFGLFRNTPWSTLPRTGVHEIKRTFQQALGAAQRYIYIEDQAFTATDSLFPSLVAACRRGVKVIAVLPGAGDPLDAPGTVPRALSAEVVSGILRHLTPTQQMNLAVWQLAGVTVHSKLFLIDDEMVEIGSANFMDRSMQFTTQGDDSECTVAVVSTGTMVADLRVQIWAEHLRVSGSAERAEIRDLSKSLGFWRPAWGTGLTLPHPDTRLIFVGPTAGGGGGSASP